MNEQDTLPSRGVSRRATAVLVLILSGVGLLLFHGQLVSSDEVLMARETFSLAREGKLTFPEVYGRTTSQYGILCSLQGVPWAWVEMGLRSAGLIKPDVPFTLVALANVVSVILLALYVRALSRRLGASETAAAGSAAALVLATPFLSYSESFFSEPATTLTLTAAAYHLGLGMRIRDFGNEEPSPAAESASAGWSPLLAGLWLAAGLHARVITGVLWPVWAAAVWSQCRAERRPRVDSVRVLLRLAVFPVLGILLLLILNTVQRGGPLRMGYETSEFSTPLATGLYGLLFSPDRGILLQAPLVWLGLWAWVAFGKSRPREGLVCGALIVVWTVLHATFWTWHGGWTPGPRFLLPLLPWILLPLGLLFDRWRVWGGGARWVAVILLGWGAVQAVAQTLVNPLDWNNELWGFLGQIESRFLFEPQVSSWRGIWTLLGDGALRPLGWACWLRRAPLELATLFLILGAGCLAVGATLMNWRPALAGWVEAARSMAQWTRGQGSPVVICLLGAIIVWSAAGMLSGPRGLAQEVRVQSTAGQAQESNGLDKRLRWEWVPGLSSVDGKQAHAALVKAAWEGYLDLPLAGKYGFFLKARGVYTVMLDGKVLFGNDDPAKPQHIPQTAVDLKPGRHPVRILLGPDREGGGLLRLFWQWPGEGVLLEPLDVEYVLPRELSPVEESATWLRRHGLPLGLVVILTVAVASAGRRKEETPPTT